MKIELVGGPLCGALAEVEFLNGTVKVHGQVYRRRDRPFNSEKPHPFGMSGDRLYDYVKPDQRG